MTAKRVRTDVQHLLEAAVPFVEESVRELEISETNLYTGKIDDEDVRRDIRVRKRWLSQVKAALQ